MAVLGLRFCARAFSSCGKWGPLFIAVRLSLSRPLSLRSTGSRRAGSVIVAHGPSRGMWDLPRPGLEPVSPASAGRFSTTAPPGKPHPIFFFDEKMEAPKYSVTCQGHQFIRGGSGIHTQAF